LETALRGLSPASNVTLPNNWRRSNSSNIHCLLSQTDATKSNESSNQKHKSICLKNVKNNIRLVFRSLLEKTRSTAGDNNCL